MAYRLMVEYVDGCYRTDMADAEAYYVNAEEARGGAVADEGSESKNRRASSMRPSSSWPL